MAEFEPKVEPVVVPVVAPVAAPPIDYEANLASARSASDIAKKEFEVKAAAADARMSQLETILANRFAGKDQPPATESPIVTDEDFLTPDGARKAATRLAEEKALQVGQALDAQYRGTMTTLLEDQFDARYESLKTREYFKYIKDDLEAAIKANPKLKLAPKSLDVLYNAMVGAKSKEIVAAESAVRSIEPATPVRRAPGSSRETVVSPTGETGDTNEVYLSDAETLTRNKFAALGVKITPERWAQIRAERHGMAFDSPNLVEERRK